MIAEQFHWWQRSIMYQIFVRSFQDSRGTGEGDLPGVIDNLDYLQWLGMHAIWLSPIFPSPMVESGYDVGDYTGILPRYGTLKTFDTLLHEAHQRGIKVILDFVPNHTSDQHPWFQESRSSRDNAKRSWYIWRDPQPDGSPPNNWVSAFGGSAWEYDETTGQYYYHAFLEQQPDLNWRNPEVQGAISDALRFWLDRGVDGFRMDAIWHLIKDEQFRDNPPNPDYSEDQAPDRVVLHEYTRNRPEVHGIVALLRRVIDEYDDRLLVGEMYLGLEQMMAYYGVDAPELHLPLNLMFSLTPWNASAIGDYIDAYMQALPPDAWPTWTLSSHDGTRLASRTGPAQARVAAMLLLTLPGTPTIYYGDEIGMHDVEIPRKQVRDPREKRTPGRGLGRDPVRTPMQWDSSINAGFSGDTPWLPVARDYETVNVATERDESRSLLALYRRLIGLRRSEPALLAGTYAGVYRDKHLLAYQREGEDRTFLIILNLTSQPQSFDMGAHDKHGRVVLTTHFDRTDEEVGGTVELRGDEGILVRLQ